VGNTVGSLFVNKKNTIDKKGSLLTTDSNAAAINQHKK
jgi:hypothetical protein